MNGFNWKYLIPFYGIYEVYKAPGPSKESGWIASILITLLTIIILIGGGNKEKEISSNSEDAVEQEEQKPIELPLPGQMIQTDFFEVTLTKFGERRSVGGRYLNQSASEGAIYVTVQYQYKNISGKPLSFINLPQNLRLIGPDGMQYEKDLGASVYFATEVRLDKKIISNLNPGITSKDAAVFEIAKDSWATPGWIVYIDADDDVFYKSIGKFPWSLFFKIEEQRVENRLTNYSPI